MFKCSDSLKFAFVFALCGICFPMEVAAEDVTVMPDDLGQVSVTGNMLVFDDMPNTLWIMTQIEQGDYFDFRRVLRRNSIDTVILDSPGGSVHEGLQIAAAISDQGLSTFIPDGAVCASACAYLFFAGEERRVSGELGVHQFYGANENAPMDLVQFTVSEIVGFLNEFDTPPFVFEYMFEDREMHFFSEDEKLRLQRARSEDQQALAPDAIELITEKYARFMSAIEEVTTQDDSDEPVIEIQPEVGPEIAPDEQDIPNQNAGYAYSSFYNLRLQCFGIELNKNVGFANYEVSPDGSSHSEIPIVWWPNGTEELLGKVSLFEQPVVSLEIGRQDQIFKLVGDLEMSPTLLLVGIESDCEGELRLITESEAAPPSTSYTATEITVLIQTELNRLGCALGREDGIVGRRSIASLRAFIENSDLEIEYNVALFEDLNFLRLLTQMTGPICLTAPVPEPISYDVSGVWEANFSCPRNRSFVGNSEIYGRNGNFYRIRYWDNAGVGHGTGTLRGRNFFGYIRYEGQEINFSYHLSSNGRTLTGNTITSTRNGAARCNVSVRMLHR